MLHHDYHSHFHHNHYFRCLLRSVLLARVHSRASFATLLFLLRTLIAAVLC